MRQWMGVTGIPGSATGAVAPGARWAEKPRRTAADRDTTVAIWGWPGLADNRSFIEMTITEACGPLHAGLIDIIHMLELVEDAAVLLPDNRLYGSLHELDVNNLDSR